MPCSRMQYLERQICPSLGSIYDGGGGGYTFWGAGTLAGVVAVEEEATVESVSLPI